MALIEHTVFEPNYGRIVNANLSEYLVPVNADIPNIQMQFIDEYDPYVNSMGIKSIGEL